MTRIGKNLWYFDQSYWWIGQTTVSGGLGATFFPSDYTIKDLAWDGMTIWAINPSGMIIGYNPSGSIQGAIPGLLPGGEKGLWGVLVLVGCLEVLPLILTFSPEGRRD